MSIGKTLKGLFGDKRRIRAPTLDILGVCNPQLDADRIALSLSGILQKQVSMLDLELWRVPTTDRFASAKCRGALLGTAIGITMIEVPEPSHKQLTDSALAAFVLVYGEREGLRLADQTIRESATGPAEVASASDWAIKNVAGVYASEGTTSAIGFYAACTGMI